MEAERARLQALKQAQNDLMKVTGDSPSIDANAPPAKSTSANYDTIEANSNTHMSPCTSTRTRTHKSARDAHTHTHAHKLALT